MSAPNRKLSGLISNITDILSRVKEALLEQFYDVEVCDTRKGQSCVNLRVTTAEGRIFGFRLVLCAQNTTKMARRFVHTSLADLRTQESSELHDHARVFVQIARSSRNDLDRLITRITIAIKDVVRRWGNFGSASVAGIHVRGGNGGRAYARIKNLFKMAAPPPSPTA